MDLHGKRHYLGHTMLRRVLTFLAVLCGFAVLGAPVHASAPADAAASVEASASYDGETAGEVFGAQTAPALRARPVTVERLKIEAAAPVGKPATVRLRIDRARE